MKVLFWPELPKNLREMADALCPEAMELDWLGRDASESEMRNRLRGVECLFSHASGPVFPGVYPDLGRLKLVQLLSAGYDFLDIELARSNRLVVCTNGGANAISVAEHTVLLILSVLRRLTALDASMRTGRSERDPARNRELAGRSVGLLGFGLIGREVAKRLHGFEVELLYHDLERASGETEAALGASFRSLHELLAESDILSLHTSLNDQTRQIINRETLSLMKPGVVLVNTARGELVDEDALAEALQEGALMGAGLDVFAVEPPPSGHPLLAAELNVVATPHAAGPTWESFPRRIENAFANAERVRRGEAPLWVIPELR
ncbi:MAG: 2-hydroxyacid dehydrogenase [Acidimicrobiaceae bacterium]|nr:2-hydroxyacid dehydrogenase [Acidimicrobiaceae bacterium]